jgi:hypothetical protein
MKINDFDIEEMRRRAQARIDWDGGCALPDKVPPEFIVALIKDYQRVTGQQGTAPRSQVGRPMLAYLCQHNAHGLVFDKPIWLPEGDEPETDRSKWKRAPWLDGRMP